MSLAPRIDRLDQAEVSAPSTNVTLLATSASYQVMTPSTSIDVNLPSVDIKKGRIFNISTYTDEGDQVIIRSSDSSFIDQLGFLGNGTDKCDSLIRVVALQDTPTTAAHWKVLDVVESGVYTPTFTETTGYGGTVTIEKFTVSRRGSIVNVAGGTNSSSAASSAGSMQFTLSLPTLIDNFTFTGDVSGTVGYWKSTPQSSGGYVTSSGTTNALITIHRDSGTDAARLFMHWQYRIRTLT